MGYTIVYDRLFLRCGDRFIPFCLYGANNCTQISYKTGCEIRERSWHTFIYDDEMILGTAEEIMEIVKKLHPGDRQENFTYHGHWLNDVQVIKFFENGIKHAVTVEELQQQAHESLDCCISAYVPDDDVDNYPPSERWNHEHHERVLQRYPKSTEELIQWIDAAKAEKANLLSTGKARSAYITIRCASEEPLYVIPRSKCNEPCLLYAPRWGYVISISKDRASFTDPANWKNAQVFLNSEEAYLAADTNPNLGAVKLVSVRQMQSASKKNNVVLSVQTNAGRRYVEKKTPKRIYYTSSPERAKKFSSDSAALRWYKEKLDGKVTGLSAPQTITIPSL